MPENEGKNRKNREIEWVNYRDIIRLWNVREVGEIVQAPRCKGLRLVEVEYHHRPRGILVFQPLCLWGFSSAVQAITEREWICVPVVKNCGEV